MVAHSAAAVAADAEVAADKIVEPAVGIVGIVVAAADMVAAAGIDYRQLGMQSFQADSGKIGLSCSDRLEVPAA